MTLFMRTAPRLTWLASVLAALTACKDGTDIRGDVTGRYNGKEVRMTAQADSSGAPINFDASYGDGNRDVARHWALLGGNEYNSSAGGSSCVTEPCPNLAVINVKTPPALIYAGVWTSTDGSVGFGREGEKGMAFFNTPGSRFEMDFAEPDFSSFGDITMVNTGKVYAVQEVNGEKLEFKGDFRLEFQCHKQSVYYRDCGNMRQEGLKPNPNGRPYAENTCPAELVAPYEGEPRWDGKTTLRLGDQKVDCREGHSSQGIDGSWPLLCYQRRTGVKAGGCTWRVHFLTDGSLQQFAVAGFSEGDCAQKTCNTYR